GLDDAMAELRAYLPAPDATAIYQRIDAFAHAAPPDDERQMHQRRADAFTDLLLGTTTTTDTADATTADGTTSHGEGTTGDVTTGGAAAGDGDGDGDCTTGDGDTGGTTGGTGTAGTSGAGTGSTGGDNNGAGTGSGGNSTKVVVRVTVPISTLMGLDDQPG